ncbi:NADH-quinone oxidoreductase subunit C [Limisalsivibrio acetivorans]|uniref:NADH-quinone oxidoreductase subunit C n=1 Tax=Limisalsivibrio acetivorans TaxID=1304888 RepID=UPI0003B38F27|nr:NADH-quinone oxidoreductase subunit C [Limisalsivibrio acetivorans]
MTFEELKSSLEQDFQGKVNCYEQFGCNFIRVKDEADYLDVLTTLKEKYSFKYMVDVVAVHWPKKEDKFEVTNNIFSIENKLRVFVKLSKKDNVYPTITGIWKGANIMEREQYDLVGVEFEGHPDLRRVLLPDFFEGHPLRKDFPLKERKWFNKTDEQGLGIKYSK